MTYNVFGETLSLTQSINHILLNHFLYHVCAVCLYLTDEDVDNEEVYKMAAVMSQCGGLRVMLKRYFMLPHCSMFQTEVLPQISYGFDFG